MKEERDRLIDAWLDADLSVSEAEQLNVWIKEAPEHAARFAERTHLHSHLHDWGAAERGRLPANGATMVESPSMGNTRCRNRSSRLTLLRMAAIIVAFLVAGLLVYHGYLRITESVVGGDDKGEPPLAPEEVETMVPEASPPSVQEVTPFALAHIHTHPPDDVGYEWKELRPKAAELVLAEIDDHARKLLANGMSMQDSMDGWYETLSSAEKRAVFRGAAYVKGLVDPTGRIRQADRKVGLPPKGYYIWKEHQTRQNEMDAAREKRIESVRRFYLKHLREAQAQLDGFGLMPQSREIQEEIDACGEDVASFLEYLKVEP